MLYTSIVAERIGLRRSFAVIMAMSFALNFILALALLLQQPETRTIVVPPTLAAEREVWTFDEAGPGAPYLERWALSVLSHAASVTPETVDSSRRVVLQHVDPGFYGKLEEALIVEADRIKKEHPNASANCPREAAGTVSRIFPNFSTTSNAACQVPNSRPDSAASSRRGREVSALRWLSRSKSIRPCGVLCTQRNSSTFFASSANMASVSSFVIPKRLTNSNFPSRQLNAPRSASLQKQLEAILLGVPSSFFNPS